MDDLQARELVTRVDALLEEVEAFPDPAGETALAVLTPVGGKLNQGLKLALQARLRQRLGIAVVELGRLNQRISVSM